ncbi:MAG: biotin--[acetyl-CoA-carboxylase] ligase [Actinobacteria bacterium]|nr:biotin--[acetyl-CoA-carboxylase] ligase [Actinomycetota bacterium]
MAADLRPEVIEAALRGRFGRPLRSFESVGSTNDVALDWAAAGAPEGAVVVADHQTSGRGRRGRRWLDPDQAGSRFDGTAQQTGSLLMFSLILRPSGGLAGLSLLTTAAGLACAEAVEGLTGLDVKLKWPNDVMLDGRKLAGILVESRAGADAVDVAVLGCGVNVDWPEDAMPDELAGRAVSLSARSSRVPTRPELLAAVLVSFEHLYPRIADRSGAEELIRAAEARSAILGEVVAVGFPDGSSVRALARRLMPNGALELDCDGVARVVEAADIEQIR